ncbi:MAG TPA: DUF5615 family PIN-like protein [Planctomycetota bacterium]|nr:DUF5615 family PIN-like protein [Planctomycetota bacterium]
MRFKIDENLPKELVRCLEAAGHEADSVSDEGLSGSADRIIASECIREGRVLVTLDMDFADVRTHAPALHRGLIVLRLARQDRAFILSVFERIIPLLTEGELAQKTWIVEADRIRIRE